MARLNYLGLENVIEWITYIASLLLVIDFSSCQVDNPGVREVRTAIITPITVTRSNVESKYNPNTVTRSNVESKYNVTSSNETTKTDPFK